MREAWLPAALTASLHEIWEPVARLHARELPLRPELRRRRHADMSSQQGMAEAKRRWPWDARAAFRFPGAELHASWPAPRARAEKKRQSQRRFSQVVQGTADGAWPGVSGGVGVGVSSQCLRDVRTRRKICWAARSRAWDARERFDVRCTLGWQ